MTFVQEFRIKEKSVATVNDKIPFTPDPEIEKELAKERILLCMGAITPEHYRTLYHQVSIRKAQASSG
jgi:hypothetical protein